MSALDRPADGTARWHVTHACGHTETLCMHTLPEQEPRLRPEASIALFDIGQEILSIVFGEPSLKSVDLSVGRWSIHRSMRGSVLRAAFPWDAISATARVGMAAKDPYHAN